jgi:hypothetical protein
MRYQKSKRAVERPNPRPGVPAIPGKSRLRFIEGMELPILLRPPFDRLV